MGMLARSWFKLAAVLKMLMGCQVCCFTSKYVSMALQIFTVFQSSIKVSFRINVHTFLHIFFTYYQMAMIARNWLMLAVP